jgi:rubrerythrin
MTSEREPRGQQQASATDEGWEDDLPGDPACWLKRVCPACGTLADADPPTTCPRCNAAIPAADV